MTAIRDNASMLDSIPSPLLVLFWPLAGAAVVLILGRFLPSWLRRVLASAAALASLLVLWGLHSAPPAPYTLAWQPINLFRMSPSLQLGSLSLTISLILAAITVACTLGIRGSEPDNPSWHGLILVALAGCFVMSMSTNLLTLVLGSGMLDLALIAIALTSDQGSGRSVWRMVVPGGLSTAILLFGSLLMSIQVGSGSFSVEFPILVVLLLALAGLLRLLVYPIQPRHLNSAKSAATLFLSIGAGVYLLSTAQTLHDAPLLSRWPWMLAIGVIAMLAGGMMAWTKTLTASSAEDLQAVAEKSPGFDWLSFSIHQTGLTLTILLLTDSATAFPLLSLALALGILAIYWDAQAGLVAQAGSDGPQGAWQQVGRWREQAQAGLVARFPRLGDWQQRDLPAKMVSGIAIIALASLAGAPLTAGSVTRWSLYGQLLSQGLSAALVVALLADTLLAAALWLTGGIIIRRVKKSHSRPTALLSMLILLLLLILTSIAPDALLGSVGLERTKVSDVSLWGLGLVYVLPWLIGAWVARVSGRLGGYTDLASRVLDLDWLYAIASWIGRRTVSAIRWMGMAGEGDGWWGWALIILALGIMFLTIR